MKFEKQFVGSQLLSFEGEDKRQVSLQKLHLIDTTTKVQVSDYSAGVFVEEYRLAQERRVVIPAGCKTGSKVLVTYAMLPGWKNNKPEITPVAIELATAEK